MSRHPIPVGDLPDVLRLANDKAQFNSTEVAKLFGFSSVNSVFTSARSLSFPKPDGIDRKHTKGGICDNRKNWTAKTLRKEWYRRKASCTGA